MRHNLEISFIELFKLFHPQRSLSGIHLWFIQEQLTSSIWLGQCKENTHSPPWRERGTGPWYLAQADPPMYKSDSQRKCWRISDTFAWGTEKPFGRGRDHKSIHRINGIRVSSMGFTMIGPHAAKGDISIRWDALASGIALSTLNSVQVAGESSFTQSSFEGTETNAGFAYECRSILGSPSIDTTAAHIRIYMSKALLQWWSFAGLCKCNVSNDLMLLQQQNP